MRALVAASVLLAIAGCSDPPPPTTSSRGVAAEGPSSAPSSALPPMPGSAPRAPSSPRGSRGGYVPRPPPLPPAAGAGAGGAAAGDPPSGPTSQELSAALARAFGTPASCISDATREHLDERLGVQVSVTVTRSGIVTRASVTSSPLSRDDIECMERHAEGLRFASDVPDAPRTITTTVEYEVHAGRIEPPASQPPAVVLGPGRLAPDTTLPAAGTETARPAGFVTPSSTLPAQVEPNSGPLPGRPAGFVPPSSTLPAQAP